MKSAAYVIALALVLATTIWFSSLIVAKLLENYKVYVGIAPFGVWVYPYAWLASSVRLAGQIVAGIGAAAIFVKVAFRKTIR